MEQCVYFHTISGKMRNLSKVVKGQFFSCRRRLRSLSLKKKLKRVCCFTNHTEPGIKAVLPHFPFPYNPPPSESTLFS
jgi:hypothetical protein